jgi:soluble lytic murein transglycosylase
MRCWGSLQSAFAAVFVLSSAVPTTAHETVQNNAAKILAMVPMPRPQANPGTVPSSLSSIVAVLSAADVNRYWRVFALQGAGHWAEADRLIAKLNDNLLVGHVLAQRYLHPTAYRSRYNELKAWLAAYADHPEASRLYKLALSRRPKNQQRPAQATYKIPIIKRERFADQRIRGGSPLSGLSTADRKAGERAIVRVHSFMDQGATLSTKRMLQDKSIQRLMSASTLDRARSRLATGYFTDGHDDWALEWASLATRSAKQVPEAVWIAGLAAWRLDQLGMATKHFEALAARDDLSPGMVSAAAFWAARAHLRTGQPQAVSKWLERAADQPRTFYGMLARRLLGQPLEVRWADSKELTKLSSRVAATPAGRRALALLEIGETDRAAAEFLGLSASADTKTAQGILAIVGHAGMPALAIKLDSMFHPDSMEFDGGAYPLPVWSPASSFSVDRALVFALIRQESRFNPNARSHAGARGLMQLMPATASWVAGDRTLRGSRRDKLLDPFYNLELGQRYIKMLLSENDVSGDLLRMLLAWNGGPGNLSTWLRNTKHHEDPLLFIEAITRRETREFAAKVLSNLWIYRDRLGQSTPSLDNIAAGHWPAYKAQDGNDKKVMDIAPL